MAGSYRHIINKDGSFCGTDLLDHMGDAYEALEDCYNIIQKLKKRKKTKSPIEKFEAAMKRRACSWSLCYRGNVRICFQLEHIVEVNQVFGETLNEAAQNALEIIEKGK